MKILQTSPGASYLADKADIDSAIFRVLESGWYILGKEVTAFEEFFAQWLGAKFCIGVANGTDADELLLRAVGVNAGDKVATVANTAVATVAAIERIGAVVRFVDVDPETFTMSPDSLRRLFIAEPDIKAVVAVHLFGHPADLAGLTRIADEYGAIVVEDCAQAHGAEYHGRKCGTICKGGAFSFYPTKNLGAIGDGGAIVTSDPQLAERLKALRQYGWTKRYISEFSGVNSRLDELQAAILSVKLKSLETKNNRRREIARQYLNGLKSISDLILPIEKDGCKHVYHQFVLRVVNGKRNALLQYMTDQGIGCAIHYPVPIHQQSAYRKIPLSVQLPNIEEINPQLLSLPMYPELTDEEAKYVIEKIQDFFR